MIDSLPVVDNSTDWESIIEMRKDIVAIQAFRNIRLWMNDLSKCDSTAQMHDKINQRIANYKWSIEKHGLNSRLGYFANIIKLENICTAASGSWLCSHLISQSPLLNAFVGTTILLGQSYIGVRKVALGIEDIRRSNPELAYITAISDAIRDNNQ